MKSPMGKAFVLLAVFLSFGLILPSAWPDSKARLVRISYVDGTGQIDRGEGKGYEPAVMNMPVVEGTRLWTKGDNALAEVELEDSSDIRLTPDTIVKFDELSLRSNGQRVTAVTLEQGTAYIDARGHEGDFRVVAGPDQIQVPRNTRFRLDLTKDQLKIAVFKGDVKVSSADKNFKVKKDETLAVDLSAPNQGLVAKGISANPYEQWNQQRENYHNTYASNDLGYNGYSSAYSYGISDLNYYGNSFYAPGWGWLWQPFGLGYGWNPFMDGSWMWYPGYGYMWVSSYPWGWMPYHYGTWNFVPGYGWCWAPAMTWTRWVPYTPVVHAPVGYVQPKPPRTALAGNTPQPTISVGHGTTTLYPAALGKPGSTSLPLHGMTTRVGPYNPSGTAMGGKTASRTGATAGGSASGTATGTTTRTIEGRRSGGSSMGREGGTSHGSSGSSGVSGHSKFMGGQQMNAPQISAPAPAVPRAPEPARISTPRPEMSTPRMSEAPRMSMPSAPTESSGRPSGGGWTGRR